MDLKGKSRDIMEKIFCKKKVKKVNVINDGEKSTQKYYLYAFKKSDCGHEVLTQK